jgi:glycerol-3-phosphate O-acyltransferase/dihydroxyacetone phosphate acyltransferase
MHILSLTHLRSLNPLFMSLSNPNAMEQVRNMRENLSDTITAFVDENGSTALSDFDKHKFDDMELHDQVKSRSILKGVSISSSNIQKWFDDRQIFNLNSDSESE